MRRALIYPLVIMGFLFASLSLGTHISRAGFIRVGDFSTAFQIERACLDGFRITGAVTALGIDPEPTLPRTDTVYARMYAANPIIDLNNTPVGTDQFQTLPIVGMGSIPMAQRSTSIDVVDEFGTLTPTHYWGTVDISWSAPLTNDPYIGIFWGSIDPSAHLAQVILRSQVENCSLFAPTPFTDGRMNPASVFGAIYPTSAGGLQIFGINNGSQGFPVLSITPAQLAAVPCPPARNTLIARTNDGRFALYRLTTCEYQINMGPNAGGRIEVTIFDRVPPSRIYGYSFVGAALPPINGGTTQPPSSTSGSSGNVVVGGGGCTYMVQAGDTLFRIGRNNGLTVAQMQAANPQITDPTRIFVGQVLTIPGCGPGI